MACSWDAVKSCQPCSLNEAEGELAFSQRYRKKLFKEADRLDADAFAPAEDLAKAAPRATTRPASPGGLGGAINGSAAIPSLQSGRQGATKNERGSVAAENVEVVGNAAIYRRGNVWYAENARDVDLGDKDAKIVVVKRFSEDYFKLVKENSAADNAMLSKQKQGEELIIRLRGTVYHIK